MAQGTRFQRVADSRRLVTPRAGKRPCGVSSRDWPRATGGRARSWRCRGSSCGFPFCSASGPGWRLWTPCDRRLWGSIADACGCGRRGGTFHCNTGTCGRRRNSSAGAEPATAIPVPGSSKEEKLPRAPTKKNRNKTQEEEFLFEAPEEDPTQAPSDVQTGRIIRLSDRRPHWRSWQALSRRWFPGPPNGVEGGLPIARMPEGFASALPSRSGPFSR